MAIYNELKHGKIILDSTNFIMCVLPDKHNNRTETQLTKKIKEFYKSKGFLEEVCIWERDFIQKICVIDLYNPLTCEGIEIHNKNKSNFKRFLSKLRLYEEYFFNINVILLNNQPLILKRLEDNCIKCMIMNYKDFPTLSFPMES
jgi:hypothetical protein